MQRALGPTLTTLGLALLAIGLLDPPWLFDLGTWRARPPAPAEVEQPAPPPAEPQPEAGPAPQPEPPAPPAAAPEANEPRPPTPAPTAPGGPAAAAPPPAAPGGLPPAPPFVAEPAPPAPETARPAAPAPAVEPAPSGAQAGPIAAVIAPSGLTLREGDAAAGLVVELAAPAPRPLALILATLDGTAQAGPDYEALRRSVTIQPGARAIRLPLRLVDDRQKEGTEHVRLVLTADPRALALRDRILTVTIEDDD